VPAQVGTGDPVTRLPQHRSEEPVAGPQVTQAGDEHDERAVARDIVTDATVGAGEVARRRSIAGMRIEDTAPF
jgi:hypothetical protein